MSAALTPADAAAFADCIEGGGVVVFPADTVYGLACDPENPYAVKRLYALKGRPADKPAAVMWFDRDAALTGLPDLPPRTHAAAEGLLPGRVTLLLPNRQGRFPLAAGPGGDVRTLGVRVPDVPALAAVPLAVLQSSANHAGGPDATTIAEVPEPIRMQADLVLDAGRLPGTPSTVIDLQRYEDTGEWSVIREGAVATADVARALGIVGHP
ncbi:MAG TPA: L-threonylcarbamoyladenylate synthase [Conexibacter sp.]|nr:L-threonylcarbamoyladenylate synthase [Conexibacter sp.]